MIEIPKLIIEKMIRQAYNELPNEACGLLTGKGRTVHAQYPLKNIDVSPEHFSFDPAEQFDVLKKSRETQQKIIANYHSHPSTPARPSEEDVRLAYDPGQVYIIISLAENEPIVKAFSIKAGKVEEVEIKEV